MQAQPEIAFDQLLRIVKTLPAGQLKLLKAEIERKRRIKRSKTDLETLLLKGPVATKKQLSVIKKNRKAVNQWRMN